MACDRIGSAADRVSHRPYEDFAGVFHHRGAGAEVHDSRRIDKFALGRGEYTAEAEDCGDVFENLAVQQGTYVAQVIFRAGDQAVVKRKPHSRPVTRHQPAKSAP
ncbi:hypothetical protein Apa02nite_094670 [Actinoplanes palleronii]|uniref:Uncharacterized protein n=1 Tax=Actinoplanes palleronii TaxID=113570 RepID=A0ABQ4BRR1_9ACTN|nr:hypothetical protein Apa02nite_094670 [Actinoplanes palleronii]